MSIDSAGLGFTMLRGVGVLRRMTTNMSTLGEGFD